MFSFLSEQEVLTERRLQDLNTILDNNDFSLPSNVSETLNSLRLLDTFSGNSILS